MISDPASHVPVPDAIEEITADWMTAVLRETGVIACRVEDLAVSHFGEGIGMMSFMVRCRPRYDAPRGGEPASLIVKLEPKGEATRKVIEQWRGFEREIRFYREIADVTPLRVPHFYYGAFDAHRAVIVLEDLGHLTVRDQVHGLRDQETLTAVGQIARLHAKYWDSPSLCGFDWIPENEERLTSIDPDAWALFQDVYGLRVGPEAVALGQRLVGQLDWLREEIARRPQTICHGDFRADNLFFGEAGSNDEVVIFDWQVCTRCIGALDVSRLLGGSESEAERIQHFNEVFRVWHEGLQQAGLSDYDIETALADLRLGVLVNLCTPVRILSIWGPDAPGRRGQLLDVIATRMFAFAVEVEAAQRLP
ncbi:MAG: phosphotransferase [Alphaproteobacteria bacterium]|nr:phosphotransferase [Alphaproteobacteria bacterium]